MSIQNQNSSTFRHFIQNTNSTFSKIALKKEIPSLKSLKSPKTSYLKFLTICLHLCPYTCSTNSSITLSDAPSAAAPVLWLQDLMKEPSSAKVFLFAAFSRISRIDSPMQLPTYPPKTTSQSKSMWILLAAIAK